jgi:hypothetical protein
MALSILVIAESGAGKSTSIERLDPKETFIINVANKPLPFRGWRKNYSKWNSKENPTGNLYTGATPQSIEACMKYVNEKRPEIKNLIIDDFQYMSSFEYFDRIGDKGFDKWTDLGANLARIARLPQTLREDLRIVFMTHAEESVDLEGRRKLKAKTMGNLVDKNLTLEGLFAIVIYGKVKKDRDGNIRYVFETQSNGENTCKSPKGMFDTFEIPNDLQLVMEAIFQYEN